MDRDAVSNEEALEVDIEERRTDYYMNLRQRIIGNRKFCRTSSRLVHESTLSSTRLAISISIPAVIFYFDIIQSCVGSSQVKFEI